MRRPYVMVRLVAAVLAYMFVMSAFEAAPVNADHAVLRDNATPPALQFPGV